VVYEAQWVNGDTGCGAGTGCMYLDALTVNGVRYFPLVQYCADKPTNSDPNCAQEALVPHQGWTHWGAGNQHQIDLSSVSSCGQGSTCQGARNIYTNDITATQTTQGTASGTYAIEGSTAPTPVISMPNQTVVGQWDTISDALSNATIYWCYGAVGTCNNFQTYSGEFWVGPSSPPTETVCAYATAPGYTQSATTCNYYVAATNGTTTTPSITLASGTYQMPKSTTITDSNSAAAILWCYTGTGTCTPNTMYTGSIYIDPASTETVCATAWAPEAAQSSAVCNSYTNAQ
jgi:hypothetical protein